MEVFSLLRRDSIIFTSIDAIHESGLQALSTKEVAKRLKISEGTIFRYFAKKHELLYAVLEHFSQYDQDIIETTRIRKMKPVEALLFYISSKTANYENYPAITAITQSYDVIRRIPELKDKLESILFENDDFIRRNIEEAKRAGDLTEGADSEVLTDIITSVISGVCLKWRMSECQFSLRARIMQAVLLALNPYYLNK